MANNGNGKGNGKRFKLQSLALAAVAIAFFAVIVASMLIAIRGLTARPVIPAQSWR